MAGLDAAITEFQEKLIAADGVDVVLGDSIFGGDVRAFGRYPKAAGILDSHIRRSLGHPAELEIVVVGSAKTGFSLKPEKAFAKFHDRSDVDVIIISAALFDDAWQRLLRLYYPMEKADLT